MPIDSADSSFIQNAGNFISKSMVQQNHRKAKQSIGNSIQAIYTQAMVQETCSNMSTDIYTSNRQQSNKQQATRQQATEATSIRHPSNSL